MEVVMEAEDMVVVMEEVMEEVMEDMEVVVVVVMVEVMVTEVMELMEDRKEVTKAAPLEEDPVPTHSRQNQLEEPEARRLPKPR